MPRLLLVDDNPSIHKIAESLLAQTQIELVCVESGSKALGLIESSPSFDVALIDISMAGMDGWELLSQLRNAPGTARLPIAMMAGVLDTVDPDRLANAPIQGFIKKPVELRDLADRVRVLLETPVPEPPPPPAAPSAFETLPVMAAQSYEDLQAKIEAKASEDDILDLSSEDLYPEEEPSVLTEEPVVLTEEPTAEDLASPIEEDLDLEELDFDGLKDLPGPTDQPSPVEVSPFDAPTQPEVPLDTDIITAADLPDLGEDEKVTQEFGEMSLAGFPEMELLEALPEDTKAEAPLEEVLEEVPLVAAAPPAPQESAPPAQDLAATLLADAAFMDALAKAVAARLSDQALREVAWEVMPEIAERLNRL